MSLDDRLELIADSREEGEAMYERVEEFCSMHHPEASIDISRNKCSVFVKCKDVEEVCEDMIAHHVFNPHEVDYDVQFS